MVSKIQAWKASDGSLHKTEKEAQEADAMIVLSKLDIFNHATRLACVKNADLIVAALIPLCTTRSK